MLRFIILTTLLASCSAKIKRSRGQYFSAASEGQINFAIESKYDDTGPLIKQEKAYKTYKNLKDALFGYLDDPDTKLPEEERYNAIEKLISNYKYYEPPYNLAVGKKTFLFGDPQDQNSIKTNEVQRFSHLDGFSKKKPAYDYGTHDTNLNGNHQHHQVHRIAPSTEGTVGYYWFSDNLGNRHSVQYLGDAKFGRSVQLDVSRS